MNNHAAEVRKVADALVGMDLQSASLSRSFFYAHLPLALVDAIYSIGVRYGQVEQAVQHFAHISKWTVHRPLNSSFPEVSIQRSVSELLAAFDSLPSGQEYHTLFSNKGFVNPASSSPTRKANVVRDAALILQRRQIEVFQDLLCEDKIAGFEDEFKSLPGQSSGVALRYFKMLTGTENEIKPDRWIIRFLYETVGRRPTPDEAVKLICCAADELRQRGFQSVTPRLVDHLICSRQKRKKTTMSSKEQTMAKTMIKQCHSIPPVEVLNIGHDSIFKIFWDACRKGGAIGTLEWDVDEDERLCIRSGNCAQHQGGTKPYRIKRSTVRRYVKQAHERSFRVNHGWFCKIFNHVMSKHNLDRSGVS